MHIHEKKVDRRVQRTRQLLRDALMELIVEKGFDAVQIQDITDRANVARTTFYLHYKDKDELLASGMADIYSEIAGMHSAFVQAVQEGNGIPPEMIDTSDIDHVEEYQDFYRIMLSERGSLPFLLRMLAYLKTIAMHDIIPPRDANADTPRLPRDFTAHMLAWIEAAVADWWLKNNQQYTKKEVAMMQCYFVMFGLTWAEKLDVPQPDITIT